MPVVQVTFKPGEVRHYDLGAPQTEVWASGGVQTPTAIRPSEQKEAKAKAK